jgi:polysaccharide export outer membrane protein
LLLAFFCAVFCHQAAEGVDPQVTSYVLKPSDEITLHSIQVKEVADKVYRLDEKGNVNMPLIGELKLAGTTGEEAQALIVSKLKKFYWHPDLELTVSALHTEPISVIGSVGLPGIHQMKDKTTLLDALSLAGGVRSDAGPVVVVTRQAAYGPLPHSNGTPAGSSESVAEINLKSLLNSVDPSENFFLQPHDVISVPPAQVVYVIGNVKHAGGFALGGKPDLSVLQALALAEGLDARASPSKARIIRRQAGTQEQVAVDLKKILAGKEEDMILRPNDVLFVPSSATKTITNRTIEAAIQVATGVAIYSH